MDQTKASNAAAVTAEHRSPLLLDRRQSALLVVDVQEKLFPLIRRGPQIEWNIRRLLDGAGLLGVPHAASEQYPTGLGPTIASLREKLTEPPAKLMFSCRECSALLGGWRERSISQLIVTGIEAHVCVLQTVLDCLSMGFDAYVVVDAVGSRHELDESIALRRMEANGATLVTTESVLFEWCESAAASEFKQISKLVRENGPLVE